MKYFILFGPPGAGKGTQATAMVRKFNLCHISTGELLRSEIASGSPLGKQVDVIISQGNLVSDSMIEDILSQRIHAIKTSQDGQKVAGLLLDGFPRTLQQARDLDRMLADKDDKVDGVICLNIPDSVISERITSRARIEGRADDAQQSTILNRIKTYHEQTEPLIQYYTEAGCFYEVDGNGTIAEVEAAIGKLMSAIA